jgi:hypothetical protein
MMLGKMASMDISHTDFWASPTPPFKKPDARQIVDRVAGRDDAQVPLPAGVTS